MTQKENFVFFYSHNRIKFGDNAVFSNFYSSHFTDDNGTIYQHTEQYLMHQKALLFDDLEIAGLILKQTEPLECKKLGRKVRNFEQKIWNENAQKIMENGLYYKFTQNKNLMDILLKTDNKILVEASPRDRIWGIGIGLSNPNRFYPEIWKGTNLLGISLMNTREKIRNIFAISS